MPSNYSGNPANATDTLSLPVGSDIRTVQNVRVPLERLLDNDAAQTASLASAVAAPQVNPESYAEIRDDFTGCIFDTTSNILHSAFPWHISSTEDAVPGTDPTAHPGTASASLLATEEFEMELAGEQNSIRWGDLQDATIIARMTSSDFTNAEMFVGFAENLELVGIGNSAVGLWFKQTTSSQWMVRHKVGGVDDSTLTGVVANTTIWKTLKLHRISATQVEATLNGALVATLTDGTTGPSDSALVTIGMFARAGSAAALTPAVDMLYVRWTTSGRTT